MKISTKQLKQLIESLVESNMQQLQEKSPLETQQNKVVYNSDYGGFGLSDLAIKWLKKHDPSLDIENLPRHHPLLVKVVETLGKRANGLNSSLRVQPISGNKYKIDEYDGAESVVTPDNQDWVVVD